MKKDGEEDGSNEERGKRMGEELKRESIEEGESCVMGEKGVIKREERS